MHLAGQGESDPDRQAGYAMAALIVGLAVMAVMMTVAMPVWKQAVQREKEAELVFRGEQIARSIGLFQRKFANAYPPTLDVLVDQRFLRKKYKDPITNDDFALLSQAQQAAAAPGAAQGARGGLPQGTATPGRGSAAASPFPTPGGTPVGGIIGVTSKSTDTSIRLYKGRSHYNEWAFVYTPPAAAAGRGGAAGPRGGGGTGAGGPGIGGPGGGRGGGPGGAPSPGGPIGPGGRGFPTNPGQPPQFPTPQGPGR